MPKIKSALPYVILLAILVVRVWQLDSVPPGLTHDEAGHAHDAVNVLAGIRPIYFTVGYGREPLFDYINALVVAMGGASVLTLRLSAVAISMLAVAATYRLARERFGGNVALLTLCLYGFSFWPLATGRQLLRSALLPLEISLAALFYFRLVDRRQNIFGNTANGLGLCLALVASFYTYIPARALWLMFPFTLAVQGLFAYGAGHVNTRAIVTVLVAHSVALALATPLWAHLQQNPTAEQRIGMLSQPIEALVNGDASILLGNMQETFLAFFLDGHGDHFLAYTIPGKPLFHPLVALLAAAGALTLIIAIVRQRQWQKIVFIFWMALGLAPSFVTGPEALTTRIIGAQPVIYILPSLAIGHMINAASRSAPRARPAVILGAVTLIAVNAIVAARDYFGVWAERADVRAAYQSTLIAALESLESPAVISTVYPSAAHDPYIAELFTRQPTRWVDARYALVVPADARFQLVVPSSTPLHTEFAPLATLTSTHVVRPTDLDPSYSLYQFESAARPTLQSIATFNRAVSLVGHRWLATANIPGGVAQLLTIWHVRDPSQLGELHPPAFKTDLNLFTHILNVDGSILLQRDALDAPSWDWQEGDLVYQIHQFAIPPDTPAGAYPTRVGIYDRRTGVRLHTSDSDFADVEPLTVADIGH